MSASKKNPPAGIVWFEIAADNVKRAKTFYSRLFGWKMDRFPGNMEYWHIDTGGPDASPDGGLMPRCHPQQTITNYVRVESVDKAMAKVAKLGGKVCSPKMPVPGKGYFAMCLDTEQNTFALWEVNENAK